MWLRAGFESLRTTISLSLWLNNFILCQITRHPHLLLYEQSHDMTTISSPHLTMSIPHPHSYTQSYTCTQTLIIQAKWKQRSPLGSLCAPVACSQLPFILCHEAWTCGLAQNGLEARQCQVGVQLSPSFNDAQAWHKSTFLAPFLSPANYSCWTQIQIVGMFIRHDNFKVKLTTIPQIPSP